MLNRFAQLAIACVLCELLCLELFNVFFQHENRFRYKFFDIVQFSRSCVPQPCGWRLDYFTTEAVFCQALFFEAFELPELGSFSTSRCQPVFLNVYWFFSKASGWGFRSHSLSQRLALKYNTTPRCPCQHFLTSFFQIFCLLYFCGLLLLPYIM